MLTINALNVNDAYRAGLKLAVETGFSRQSRNGPVRVVKEPVTTRYTHPCQRVLFDPQRDANPFFHLFEALWMLAGRNDLATIAYFLPSFEEFSDDGKTLHGAYGYRWRHWDVSDSSMHIDFDQLPVLIKKLQKNADDRRAILGIWDVRQDLDYESKDIPCNDIINFQIVDGALQMYVFCRSNDIIYGCYGANAVHMSVLQEYMAAMIGAPVGAYEQISTNFHVYVERPYRLEKYWPIVDRPNRGNYAGGRWINPYLLTEIQPYPLVNHPPTFDHELEMVVKHLADGEFRSMDLSQFDNTFFVRVAQPMYQAHFLFKHKRDPLLAAHYLDQFIMRDQFYIDWLTAGKEWLLRRKPAPSPHALGAAVDLTHRARG